MLSSTTIDCLRNHFRSDLLCAIVVNSGGKTECISHFTCTGPYGKTGEIGSTEVLAPSMRVRSDLVSFQSRCGGNFPTVLPWIYNHWERETASGAILFVKRSSVLTLRAKCSLLALKPATSSPYLPPPERT